jgi:hypothetical protein
MKRIGTALSILVLAAAGCGEVTDSNRTLLEPDAVSLKKGGWKGSQDLPPGAHWSNNDYFGFLGDSNQILVAFRIEGLGNARVSSLEVVGEVHAQLLIECTREVRNRGQSSVQKSTFQHRMGINGRGEYPITQNGHVEGPMVIERGNGNGKAIEFCKNQNFTDGQIVEFIKPLGQGSFLTAPTPIETRTLDFLDIL